MRLLHSRGQKQGQIWGQNKDRALAAKALRSLSGTSGRCKVCCAVHLGGNPRRRGRFGKALNLFSHSLITPSLGILIKLFFRQIGGNLLTGGKTAFEASFAMSLSGIYAVRAGAFDGVRGILNAVDQSTSCSTTNANSTDLTRCN